MLDAWNLSTSKATLSAMSNYSDTNTCCKSCVQIPFQPVGVYVTVTLNPRFCLQELTSLLSLDVTELL